VTVLGIPWVAYVKDITGVKIPFSKLNLIFTKSNLMKYIPGNVFQYVGRNEIAIDYKLDHRDVVCATIMDVMSLSLSGLLVAVAFSTKGLLTWILQYISMPLLILAVIALFAFAAVAILMVKRIPYFSFLFRKKTIASLCKGIGLLILFHICSAGMFWVTLSYILGAELGQIGVAAVIGAWCIGYLAGYIVPGAPGGLGVREITIAFLLSAVADAPMIALGTIFMRVANILGEVLAFLCALLINLWKNRGEKKYEE